MCLKEKGLARILWEPTPLTLRRSEELQECQARARARAELYNLRLLGRESVCGGHQRRCPYNGSERPSCTRNCDSDQHGPPPRDRNRAVLRSHIGRERRTT